jgi:hypothetical protein
LWLRENLSATGGASGGVLCVRAAQFFKFGETNPRFARELVFVSHRVQNIARKARWSGAWRGKWLEEEGRKGVGWP